MPDPFIGQIQPYGFNFAPRGWAKCDGQLLAISSNTALFSLLGTTYGGDGRTTFALPDLRGRTSLHQGQGPGLTNRAIGQKGGRETETLTVQQLAAHNHAATLHAAGPKADLEMPAGNVLAGGEIYHTPPAGEAMAAASITVANVGDGQAHNNMQPHLVINWCIALVGVFPSRN